MDSGKAYHWQEDRVAQVFGGDEQLTAVSQKFDDMREAIEHFNPLRARRVKSD
jgi:hypothetical protein